MTLNVTHNGPIATLTLDRVQKRNAITLAMWQAIPDAVNQAVADGARVILLTGAGVHFSAGADIAEFDTVYATEDRRNAYFDAIRAAGDALAHCPVPTIAVLSGQCFGGAAALALACDLRIGDATTTLAITPAKLGLIYPYGDIKRLVACVGAAHATDLLVTARQLAADEAYAIGFLNAISATTAWDHATTLATVISGNAPQAIAVMKKMVSDAMRGATSETADHRAAIHTAITGSEFAEGVTAFRGKRPPIF